MLPNLLTIGAMKSGTTSLHYYLGLHPEISMSAPEKEPNFFVPELYRGGGRDWYESLFDPGAPVRGESSTNYTNCREFAGVPERISELVPDAKLVYLLRDPIERIVSDYRHHHQLAWETRDLNTALADPEESLYVSRSRYFMQLERYLAHFPPERVLIVTQEELMSSRAETLRTVFRFLGVDDSFRSDAFAEVKHRSDAKREYTRATYFLMHMRKPRVLSLLPEPVRSGVRAAAYRATTTRAAPKPPLDERVRERLVEVLAPDIERLRRFSGRAFEAWSV